MFLEIPEDIKKRMEYLEQKDHCDRIDGTPRLKRLRQIPPETVKFISLLAACSPKGQFTEIGTSAGYSILWIALSCRLNRNKKLSFYLINIYLYIFFIIQNFYKHSTPIAGK